MNYNYDYAYTAVNDDVIYNCKMSYVLGWWLRSPGLYDGGGACYVYSDGSVGGLDGSGSCGKLLYPN